jgi:hypothetical protein
MGVRTLEVGYTSATTGRGDHEVHKGHVVAMEKKNTDFNIPSVRDVIHESINKHHNNLEAQPNPLLQPLLQTTNIGRLKSCWSLDLKGN